MTHRTPDGVPKRINIELTPEAHAAVTALADHYGRSLKMTASACCLWVSSLPLRHQTLAMLGVPLKELALMVGEVAPELLRSASQPPAPEAADQPPGPRIRGDHSRGGRRP